jgi:DNA invertase Pin-like site-specific DNA recombinase
MGKVVAYLRTSTDKQDRNNQKLEVLEYARRKKIHIDDFIALSISSRQSPRDRRLEELVAQLHAGDTLIVTELSRLGRSTGEVITLIDTLLAAGIGVVVIRQNLRL